MLESTRPRFRLTVILFGKIFTVKFLANVQIYRTVFERLALIFYQLVTVGLCPVKGYVQKHEEFSDSKTVMRSG